MDLGGRRRVETGSTDYQSGTLDPEERKGTRTRSQVTQGGGGEGEEDRRDAWLLTCQKVLVTVALEIEMTCASVSDDETGESMK
jgi:hypothetical protein